ncbi:hypothetical protein AGMMS50293_13820 [Spirochaetia bacterium]|nr:hypothetical protein AGMMS50293_13820 [Spirochaetia bacterium]
MDFLQDFDPPKKMTRREQKIAAIKAEINAISGSTAGYLPVPVKGKASAPKADDPAQDAKLLELYKKLSTFEEERKNAQEEIIRITGKDLASGIALCKELLAEDPANQSAADSLFNFLTESGKKEEAFALTKKTLKVLEAARKAETVGKDGEKLRVPPSTDVLVWLVRQEDYCRTKKKWEDAAALNEKIIRTVDKILKMETYNELHETGPFTQFIGNTSANSFYYRLHLHKKEAWERIAALRKKQGDSAAAAAARAQARKIAKEQDLL